MKQSVFLFLFALGSLVAQVPDYFPLVPGSTWVYRTTGGMSPLTIRVGEPILRQGKLFFALDGYTSSRLYVSSALTRWDERTEREAPFLSFDGREFPSPFGTCNQIGTAHKDDQEYRGPVGISSAARVIRYSPGICADTGLTREVFVPWLGLVQRAETSILGERTADLIYAQIGGFTYIQEPGISFSLNATVNEKTLSARIVLQNRTAQDLTLDFASGQIYDFQIRDSRGEVIYTWSSTRLFPQATQRRVIRGEEVWFESIPIDTLRPGEYSIEGRLVNSGAKRFSASSTFSLQ
ncbi:MAG: hypothetical protein FJW36_03675 [Acidobacteria bacterium]|nr:hypothetical protein [Acidobacteriota bacterium]